MYKGLIRLLAFFGKEVSEIRRQPRLVLSLVLGPFLILLLFGIGYQGESPTLRTILVVPPDQVGSQEMNDLVAAIGPNFQVLEVVSDQDAALARLERGEVDLVEVLPAELESQVLGGQQAQVQFQYREVSPLDEQWIKYLSYVQVIELNRAILQQATVGVQQQAQEAHALLGQARTQLDALDSGLSPARREEVRGTISRLKELSGALALSPLLLSDNDGQQTEQTRQELLQLRGDLELLEQAIESDEIDEQRERIQQTRERVAALEVAMQQFTSVPPDVLVSPLQQEWRNLEGSTLPLATYYAPGVLALILQHIAVTLGALSLVRERLLGALELFSVAPVSMLQVLIGKYLGYLLFLAIITALLVGLMPLLGVPFLGSMLLFVALMVLFIVAALGVGFLISTLSTSDSQAIQLSMLVLLLSIFFSGFFLPLENFWEPVQMVGSLLPLTHMIIGMQDLMLSGRGPAEWIWGALGIIAGVTFLLTALLWRRQFRKI